MTSFSFILFFSEDRSINQRDAIIAETSAVFDMRKNQGQVTSSVGYERRFRITKLRDHREDLAKQFDECIVQHNQLQENLAADEKDRQGSLLMRVDRWELKSIEQIK